ncbi:peptidoglycan DD-transpeptidase MrdA [Blochmannia endosymbiont of Camponotus sp. C-003]|uniref:peptidoglycan DD-transpeptidase MrdA n=1 Tax=unclassified Candidatus Blochmanniella TaxID=711328 RepID=UPI002023ED42|nr:MULTISPECIES: peptidoglycan DD-transpeptidase MrdA [unclassified Candidatus Blochmannia]URJ23501.1 peptidoglycan DD-transpeptidase MrdA [Blochmannia endosymbiont of Camponotus sp. C-003]URJ28973.1 peptidoglycan DD-transpeptidase MrdA [Blochmannia endosymbiont of Camponotus sp. C-046]
MKFNAHQIFHNYSAESLSFVRRVTIACVFMLLVIGILFVHLYLIQIVHFDMYTTRSNENRIKIIPIPPKRGIIYDQNGIALALNRTIYQLEVVPEDAANLSHTIHELKLLLNLSDHDIERFERIRKHSAQFVSLPIKIDLTEEQQARFAVNKFRFSGVTIKSYQRRYYPYGSDVTHVIGYVAKINGEDIKRLNKQGILGKYIAAPNIGKLGIERYYENILHGTPGYGAVEINNRGKVIRELYKKYPIPGKNIVLTLDLNLQQYIIKLLVGNRSSVIVIDPRNGGIKALISHPSYNPNLFVDGISNTEYSILLKDNNCPLLNRATQGIYPPASTVKPYISVSALTLGVVNQNFLFSDPGWWQLPGSEKRYRDWKRWGHGELNITKALEESSDTFFYQIAYKMGIDNLSEWMRKFGYGRYTGIDLFEELTGVMPTKAWKIQRFKQPWYQGDTIPVGIGQGYWTATPVQMSKALITLINDGNVRVPHLLDSIVLEKDHVPYHQTEFDQVGDPKSNVWKIAKDGMFGAANRPNGTVSKSFADASYKAAAKSGTAQLFSLKSNQNYDPSKISESLRDHKLMTAFAPYENPTVAVVVILENARIGVSIGSITRKIFDYVLLQ